MRKIDMENGIVCTSAFERSHSVYVQYTIYGWNVKMVSLVWRIIFCNINPNSKLVMSKALQIATFFEICPKCALCNRATLIRELVLSNANRFFRQKFKIDTDWKCTYLNLVPMMMMLMLLLYGCFWCFCGSYWNAHISYPLSHDTTQTETQSSKREKHEFSFLVRQQIVMCIKQGSDINILCPFDFLNAVVVICRWSAPKLNICMYNQKRFKAFYKYKF